MQEPNLWLGGGQDGQVLPKLRTTSHPPLSVESPMKRRIPFFPTGQECHYLQNWWNAASGSFSFLSPSSYSRSDNSAASYAVYFFHSLFLLSKRASDCWLHLVLYLKHTGASLFWICYFVFLDILFCPCLPVDSNLIHSQWKLNHISIIVMLLFYRLMGS